MSPEEQDLAKRLAVRPDWTPTPGMLLLRGSGCARVIRWGRDGIDTVGSAVLLDGVPITAPDLRDPATAVCLLAMLTPEQVGRLLWRWDEAAWVVMAKGDWLTKGVFAGSLGACCAWLLLEGK